MMERGYDVTGTKERPKGFYVTYAKAALFIFTAIIAMVAVSLIVHYTGNGSGTTGSQSQITGSCIADSTGAKDPQCVSGKPSLNQSSSVMEGRLPHDVSPVLYKLEIFPHIYGDDPNEFNFTGSIWIEIICLVPTSTITMNINKIDIDTNSIQFSAKTKDAAPPVFRKLSMDTKWQLLFVELDRQMKKDNTYFLSMEFTGPIKTDFAGLYLSTFQRRIENRYLAATQFSPTDARKAFPCFDEPDRKALFDITIVRQKFFKSHSNMPIVRSEQRGPDFIADVYATTPLMSTYLVAFVVGDLEKADRYARPGLKFTCWTDAGSINKTATSLITGAKVLSHFEEYFGLPFPLPKQDMLAVPETAVGAMENWGLIIYHENMIFYDKDEYSSASLQDSANTIAHELAHQWFGNLVTMRWWGDLMLKEGFAVYFAWIGMNYVYPEWNALDMFPVYKIHSVFATDSLASSHPVHMHLSDTTEIRQVFDQISYSKGGVIIRMLNCILGDEIFRRGLKKYLNDHLYGNVDLDDLWFALGNQSRADGFPLDIKYIMDTWTLQMNYPVVKMTYSGPNRIRLTQERFLQSNTSTDTGKYTSPFGYVWRIPITYTSTTQNLNFNQTYRDIIWMNGKELEIVQPYQRRPDDWIIGNVQQWGFYRVNYDLQNWDKLVNQLNRNHTVIHVINRAQLINDAWGLAKASQLPLSVGLQLLEYLQSELDYVPWKAAIREIHYVDTFLHRSPLYSDFKRFINSKSKDPLLHYGIERRKLPHTESLARAALVTLACKYQMSECILPARDLFQKWMQDPVNNRINPDIRWSIYCTALRDASEAEWTFVFDQYQVTSDKNEKDNLLSGLSCPNDTRLLERLLEYSLNASIIQRQDAINVISYVSQNPAGQQLAWKLITSRWSYFMEAYSGSLGSLTKLVQLVTSRFTTQEQLRQLEKFMTLTPDLGTASRSFEQAVEKTKSNIQWINTNYKTVSDWLKRQSA